MPRYLLILGGADLDKRSGSPDFRLKMLERYGDWVRGLAERGQFVESHKLFDQAGRRLTMRGGEVIDGPFIEAKDAVGGVFVIEAGSLDEASEAARRCPALELQNGWIEVRVVETSRSPWDT